MITTRIATFAMTLFGVLVISTTAIAPAEYAAGAAI